MAHCWKCFAGRSCGPGECETDDAELNPIQPAPNYSAKILELQKENYQLKEFLSIEKRAHDLTADSEEKLLEALEVTKDALNELQTGCTHDENDTNYRPLGDTYGWCSTCGTKVRYKENIGRDTLAKIEEILKV